MAGMVSVARITTGLVAGLVCTVLSSCMSPAVVPEDHFYRLPEIRLKDHLRKPVFSETLAIGKIRAEGLYHERSMLYIKASTPLELHRYHYRYWIQAPSDLLQQYLLDYLDSVKAARSVTRFRPDVPVTAMIEGRVLRFERVLQPKSVAVQVAVELQYRKMSADSPIFVKQYHQDLTVSDQSMQATVESYGKALQAIFDAFLRDIENADAR